MVGYTRLISNKNNQIERSAKVALFVVLPLCLFIAAFVFFFCYYSAHLQYQEQLSFLPLSWRFFTTSLQIPGGLMAYISKFLYQFFIYPAVGAFVYALCIVSLQQLTWQSARVFGVRDTYSPLSFLPAIWIWKGLCDSDFLLTGVLGIIAILAFFVIVHRIKGDQPEMWHTLAFITILSLGLFWLCGPAFIVFPILWVFRAARTGSGNPRSTVLAMFIATLVTVAFVCAAGPRVWHYSLDQIIGGVAYYRYPAEQAGFWYILFAFEICFPALSLIHKPLSGVKKYSAIHLVLLIAICIAAAFYAIRSSYNPSREEALSYDNLLHKRQWNTILNNAERKMPVGTMSLASVNMALAQTGKLGDSFFNYPQNSLETLIPSYHGDFTLPFTTAEIFLHLGLFNECRHYAFEAMEAIPDGSKSARAFKSLALCDRVMGRVESAKKYENILNSSLFYRGYARDILTRTSIDSMRVNRLNGNEVFGLANMEKYLSESMKNNPNNRVVFDYLMAVAMLNKSWEAIAGYYTLGEHLYSSIPIVYQQALAFAAYQNISLSESVEAGITPKVKKALEDFMQSLSGGSSTTVQSRLKGVYGNTYWYYLFYIF